MPRRSSKGKQRSETPNVIATGVAEMKEGILQMESLVKEAAVLAAAGVREMDDILGGILGGIEETVARLGAELGGKEEMLREQASALDALEKELTAQIRGLENQLRKKEELLESREAELKESWSKAQDASASVLEAQLREKAEVIRQRDSALGEMQESLAAQARDLESQIRKKEELLESREAEIVDLRAKLDGPHLFPEGSVILTEENVVLLEELTQGAESEPSAGARAEAKSKVFGQLMREIVVRPGKTVLQETTPGPKKSRWSSLLAPVKKGS